MKNLLPNKGKTAVIALDVDPSMVLPMAHRRVNPVRSSRSASPRCRSAFREIARGALWGKRALANLGL